MTLQAFLLLGLAGLMHCSWNLLSKKSMEKQVFLWLAGLGSLVIFLLPFWLLYRPFPAIGWVYVLFSGMLEACYYMLLGGAYQRGDLSIVYPLARGSAPLFVTLIAFVFIGEHISTGGILGIFLIVCGIYTVHLKSFGWRELYTPLVSLRERSSQLALLTGLSIACYSTIDKVGIRYVNPLLYIYLIFLTSTIFLTPYMLATRSRAIVHEWRANSVGIIVAAVLSVFAYLLVLLALSTSKVSYTSSVREISVVFAAVLGAFVLHEPFGKQKIVGSLLIFAGIICIGLLK